jgi:hypothetical protein
MVNNPILLMIDPLMRKFNPGLKENFTSDVMERYPLPLGDLVNPLMHHPWWMYQTIYFHHLLCLHPDHPHTVDPQKLDPRILAGPAARIMTIVRGIVLLYRREVIEKRRKVPRVLEEILPLIEPLASLEYLTCTYTMFMPIMVDSMPVTAWDQLYNVLQLTFQMMREGLVSEYGTQTHSKRSTTGETVNCRDINIPSELIGILLKHNGTFWRSGSRIVVIQEEPNYLLIN